MSSRPAFLHILSPTTNTEVPFLTVTTNRKEKKKNVFLSSNMIIQGITVLIASTMSQCYVERLIVVKDYYSVARRLYLSPSSVAVFKRDPMIGLAKALSLWFVVR